MKQENDRFTYEDGDVEVKESLCGFCVHETDKDSCLEFPKKPDVRRKICEKFKPKP